MSCCTLDVKDIGTGSLKEFVYFFSKIVVMIGFILSIVLLFSINHPFFADVLKI